MIRRSLLVVGTVVAAMATPPAAAGPPTQSPRPGQAVLSGSDWPAYERNIQHSSASFGDPAVTGGNAGRLSVRWRFAPGTRLDASPTVVAGRVFVGGRNSRLYVLDAASGALVWQRQLDQGSTAFCSAKGIIGTAAVLPDPVTGTLTVYAPGAHFLYALDAATGAVRWRTAIGPATAAGAGLYFNWSSPTVAGGRIFMGLAANCESRLIRGGVVSVDQHTGALLHSYFAVPAGKVGASVWSSAASDGKSVWATTGNPDPTGTTIDDAYSVVRLAAATLARQDTWTVPSAQAADLDFGSSPTLFHGTVGGVATDLVGACNKNGLYYAWRQASLSAGPVWSTRVAGTEASGRGFCITSAAWDFKAKRLFVGAQTDVLAGRPVGGAIRALDPDTGHVLWQQPLPCPVVGSPTLNGLTHVVAVPQLNCPTGAAPSVRFFDEGSGAALGSLPTGGDVFAQPVFAEGRLFVADEKGRLTAYAP